VCIHVQDVTLVPIRHPVHHTVPIVQQERPPLINQVAARTAQQDIMQAMLAAAPVVNAQRVPIPTLVLPHVQTVRRVTIQTLVRAVARLVLQDTIAIQVLPLALDVLVAHIPALVQHHVPIVPRVSIHIHKPRVAQTVVPVIMRVVQGLKDAQVVRQALIQPVERPLVPVVP
jgi:hypothetical protein